MVVQPLWQKLKHLITFDQECQRIDAQIAHCNKLILEHKQELVKLEHAVEKQAQIVASERSRINSIELALASIDTKEAALKEQAYLLREPKAYAANQKQLTACAHTRKEHEDDLIGAWHAVEVAQKQLIQTQAAHLEQQASYNAAVDELAEKIEHYTNEKIALEEKQEEFLADIPEEWSVRYRAMKGKVANPIVPIVQDHCSACYYHVLSGDLARIKRNALLPCLNCYRYLYYDPDLVPQPSVNESKKQ